MPPNLFYTMVQKSQKWPKTQIKGGGGVLLKKKAPNFEIRKNRTAHTSSRQIIQFHNCCFIMDWPYRLRPH